MSKKNKRKKRTW